MLIDRQMDIINTILHHNSILDELSFNTNFYETSLDHVVVSGCTL